MKETYASRFVARLQKLINGKQSLGPLTVATLEQKGTVKFDENNIIERNGTKCMYFVLEMADQSKMMFLKNVTNNQYSLDLYDQDTESYIQIVN